MKKIKPIMKTKSLLLIILLFSSFSVLSAQLSFATVWNTNINNDNSKQIKFLTQGSFQYFYVDMTNSNTSQIFQNNGGDVVIDFPKSGLYKLHIVANSQFKFNSKVTVPNDAEAKKLISVTQWGNVNWNPDISQMFWYCTNLNIEATDIPNFQNVINMNSMFAECSNLKTIPNINSWNVGNVTNMSYIFFKNSLFNESLSNWNVSDVTNMEAMFAFASTFNQSLCEWNVSKVSSMRGMFRDAVSFNQPLENWNVGNVVDMYIMFYNAQSFNQPLQNWNVSKVTNMGGMFVNSKKFNQPIGNWNVSNVTTMEHMFSGTTVFNQDLGNWNLKRINLVGNSEGFNSLHNFLDSSGMDCQNYMKTLKGWSENLNTPNNLNLGVGGIRYGLDGKTYRDLIINTKGWNITGDSYSTNCNSSLTVSNISKDEIHVYPNPFSEKLYVDLGGLDNKASNIKIYSSNGSLIYDRNITSKNTTEIYLKNKLPNGVYHIIVNSGKNVKSFKVIKK